MSFIASRAFPSPSACFGLVELCGLRWHRWFDSSIRFARLIRLGGAGGIDWFALTGGGVRIDRLFWY